MDFSVLEHEEVLAKAITALSLTDFHAAQGVSEDTFSQANQEVPKHVRMLDGLSLLLIFQAQLECATTAMIQDVDAAAKVVTVKMFWTKNDSQPPTPPQKLYLDKLIESFTNLKSPDVIMLDVFSACRMKIMARSVKLVRKIRDQAEDTPEDVFNLKSTPGLLELERMLQENYGILEQGENLPQGLKRLHKFLKTMHPGTPATHGAWAIAFAYRLSESPSFSNAVLYDIGSRVRKLGEYLQTCHDMVKTCRRISQGHSLRISQEQVRLIFSLYES